MALIIDSYSRGIFSEGTQKVFTQTLVRHVKNIFSSALLIFNDIIARAKKIELQSPISMQPYVVVAMDENDHMGPKKVLPFSSIFRLPIVFRVLPPIETFSERHSWRTQCHS
jgi:hypothetical protein